MNLVLAGIGRIRAETDPGAQFLRVSRECDSIFGLGDLERLCSENVRELDILELISDIFFVSAPTICF